MSESAILSQLQAAFEPYLRSPKELHDIRVQIANHIASLVSQDNNSVESREGKPIPDHVTGVRRQYLQAYLDNLKAKEEYARLRAELQLHPEPNVDVEKSYQPLRSHLELLELQKEYQQYQTLSHFLAEAGALAEKNHIFETRPIPIQTLLEPNEEHARRDTELRARSQELNTKLEIALLQANERLKQERNLLEAINSQTSIPENPGNEAKLRALAATKAELTTWIEESLAKCDFVDHSDTMLETEQSYEGPTLAEYGQTIEQRYEEYLESRKRLLAATGALSLLTISSTAETQASNKSFEPKQSQSVRSVSVATRSGTPAISLFPYLDSQHCLRMVQSESLAQSQTHIQEMVLKHERDLSEQLLRLSDESHLLPAYPILAQSRSGTDVNDTKKFLNAWKFAIEAASAATAGSVVKQIRAGEKALDEAHTILDAREKIDELWMKLDVN